MTDFKPTLAVGIDLGGSHVTAALVDLTSGSIVQKSTHPVAEEERFSVDAIIEKIRQAFPPHVPDRYPPPRSLAFSWLIL